MIVPVTNLQRDSPLSPVPTGPASPVGADRASPAIARRATRRPLALRPVPAPGTVPTKRCPDGHPNDPEAADCRICHCRLEAAAAVVDLVPGTVGRLVLEDGTATDLVADLEIGRSPDIDGPGDALTVAGRQVSRRHLVIGVRGWRLTIRDLGSTNGTFVSRRNERGRRSVPEDRAIVLRVGDTIHFGSRQGLVTPPSA